MKKVKIAFWAIVLVFLMVFAYQNKVFFMAKHSLSLKIPFLDTIHSPELPQAILFLVFFLAGFLVAYFISLSDRFKSKKTIKNLNAAATSHLEELSALKKEVETLRSAASDPTSDSEEQPAEHME
jgi:uncharacterized integral membrane protein